MDTILAIISILAFLMSLSNWIYTLIKNHLKVDFKVLRVWVAPYSEFVEYQYHIFVENKSHKPISISSIEFSQEGIVTQCEVLKYKICSDNNTMINSFDFPINIAPLSSVGGYLIFHFDTDNQPNVSNPICLKAQTTLGWSKSVTIQPPPIDMPHSV